MISEGSCGVMMLKIQFDQE